MTFHADIAIVGAGIIGLAHAYAAAQRGLKVVVFERYPCALNASARNFGLVTVASQYGKNLQRVKQTRQIWLDIAPQADIWHQQCGHLIAVHSQAEWHVLEEFRDKAEHNGYDVTLLNREAALHKLPLLNPQNLHGALWSELEIKLDPRQAMAKLSSWLAHTFDITFHFNTNVQAVTSQQVIANETSWQVEYTIVCVGADKYSLFSEVFKDVSLCKLQMLRTEPLDAPLNPAVSGGLSLLHYPSYQQCEGISAVREQFAATHAIYLDYGIHMIANQHGDGTVTLGDSHERGDAPPPYDSCAIDDLLLQELQRLLQLPNVRVKEHWSGIYPISTQQQTELVAKPMKNVRVVTVTSGTGMSVGFALAEEVVANLLGEHLSLV